MDIIEIQKRLDDILYTTLPEYKEALTVKEAWKAYREHLYSLLYGINTEFDDTLSPDSWGVTDYTDRGVELTAFKVAELSASDFRMLSDYTKDDKASWEEYRIKIRALTPDIVKIPRRPYTGS